MLKWPKDLQHGVHACQSYISVQWSVIACSLAKCELALNQRFPMHSMRAPSPPFHAKTNITSLL